MKEKPERFKYQVQLGYFMIKDIILKISAALTMFHHDGQKFDNNLRAGSDQDLEKKEYN